MTLNGMMLLLLLALAFNLFAFALTLFTLSVHLLLALALDQFPFSRVAFAFLIDGLRRGVLHRLSDARQRVAGIMRRSRRVLAEGRGRVWAGMALAQLRQSGEGVPSRLTGVVGTWKPVVGPQVNQHYSITQLLSTV